MGEAVQRGLGTERWSRRRCLALGALGGLAVAEIAGCGRGSASAPGGGGDASGRPRTLAAAVAGSWRSAADKKRDRFRHPVQTLEFFGVKPGATVVELWPGEGWYTDILAPFLSATGGVLYEAGFQVPNPDDAAAQGVMAAFKAKFLSRPDLYGKPVITGFGPTSGPLCPPGSADVVLFLRNVHNWMAAGLAEKVLKDALAALKVGGALGVEEHRAPEGGPQDPLAASGYVRQSYLIQIAQEAGFRFEAASDINANPKDPRDHPFGVWTLPPTRRSSPRGSPPDPKFNHAKYDAIGESDRMTLRFRKP